MPRIKMTDKGGFTIKGEGVDIDTSGKFSKSNEGCLYGWQYPVSGSVASNELIVGASSHGQSDAADNDDRAPYDGSNVIDMRNFIRVGNVVKIRVFFAIKDETGTAGNISVKLQASSSKYHTNDAYAIFSNTIIAADVRTGGPPEFVQINFVTFIYNTDNLEGVQLMGRSTDYTPRNSPDVELSDGSVRVWDSIAQPFWHITVDVSGTENSSNFWGYKTTIDTEFIGKRTD